MKENEAVVLKSNKYGLTLQLNPTMPFEDLIRGICEKFAKSANFFGEAEMVLETTGRELTNEETLVVIDAIQLNSKIKIILINEQGQYKDARMKGRIDRFYSDNIFENAKIIRGSITKEDSMESDSSLLILGDVKSKASVKAKGNIIVFGAIEGSAHAGYPDNTGCYIACGHLNSKDIQIGGISGDITLKEKWSFRVRKTADEPMGITVYHGELLAEPISSGLLKRVKN